MEFRGWYAKKVMYMYVGMAVCSKVLMACVVATEVPQAWYLAVKNSYSDVWMWQSSPACACRHEQENLGLEGSRKVRKGQW